MFDSSHSLNEYAGRPVLDLPRCDPPSFRRGKGCPVAMGGDHRDWRTTPGGRCAPMRLMEGHSGCIPGEEIVLPDFTKASFSRVFRVEVPIKAQMAALAHRPKVIIATVFRRVVEMRGRQNHRATSHRIGLAVLSRAPIAMVDPAFPRTLATAASAVKADASTDGFPVLRIASTVLRRDWHLPNPQQVSEKRSQHEQEERCKAVAR